MRSALPVLALTVLVLTACSQAEVAVPPPETTEPAPVLAGVDLAQPVRALGNEPSWTVDLTGTEMVYTALESTGHRARQPEAEITVASVFYDL